MLLENKPKAYSVVVGVANKNVKISLIFLLINATINFTEEWFYLKIAVFLRAEDIFIKSRSAM